MRFIAEPQIEIVEGRLAQVGRERPGSLPGQGDRMLDVPGEIERAVDLRQSAFAEEEIAVEIGARLRAVLVEDQLEMQSVALALTGREAEGRRRPADNELPIGIVRSGERFGIRIERNIFERETAARRGIVDPDRPVLDRDTLELHLPGKFVCRRGKL